MALKYEPPVVHIDLDKEAIGLLIAAAMKSNWMPPDYVMNDWVADACQFLEHGMTEGQRDVLRRANSGELAMTDSDFYPGSLRERFDLLVAELTGDEGEDSSEDVLRRAFKGMHRDILEANLKADRLAAVLRAIRVGNDNLTLPFQAKYFIDMLRVHNERIDNVLEMEGYANDGTAGKSLSSL